MSVGSDRELELTPEHALALVQTISDAVLVVDDTGTIEVCNRAVEPMFGHAVTDLVGQPVEVLLPETLGAQHRAHRSRFRMRPEARPMGLGLELRARRADGSELDVEVSLTPMGTEGRVIAVIRDVSVRTALRAETRRVRATLDNIHDAVFVFSPETLEFSYANRGAGDQTGYTREQLLAGMTPLHVKPRFTERSFRDTIAPLVDGEVDTVELETVHRRADGTDLPVEVVLQRSGGPADDADLVAVVRDVSTRHDLMMLEERERIAADLHDMVIQRLFASGMQLEALGPLVTGAVADRLSTVVDDLDGTIAEIRRTIFSLQHPSASTLLSRVQAVVAEYAATLGFSPTLSVDGDIDAAPRRATDQLLPVLSEALANVARHARATSVDITIESCRGGLSMIVVDDGIGIPEDAPHGNGLDNLAHRAEQAGGTFSTSTGPSGSGTRVDWRVDPEPGAP